MRTVLMAFAILSMTACTTDITGGAGGGGGGGGGGDDGSGGGATCTCPDGTVMQGDDCATVCPAPDSNSGQIAVATDLATYNTQLSTTISATVTVTGSQGFSGLVALTAAVTDSTGTAITEWPVTFDNAMVSVTMNGTATAKATVTIPSTATPTLTNTLTITGTPSATTVTVASSTAQLVVANTLEIDMSTNGTTCAFPADAIAGIQVAVGTTINWKNVGTANNFVIHVDGNASGIVHQGEGASLPPSTTAPGAIWPEVVSAIGNGKVTWHCHAPNDAPNPGPSFKIVLPE